MELQLEEEIGNLEFEFIEMQLFRQTQGRIDSGCLCQRRKIDEINNALIDIQYEHKRLTGEFYYPSTKEIKDHIPPYEIDTAA